MKEAVLYEKLNDGRVRCSACKHRCVINDGKTGICATRANINGKLYLLTYGHPAAVNIDPIEKKPFFHVYPGSKLFSIGTFGCNFRCDFCQNWDLSQFPKKESMLIGEKAKVLIERNSISLEPEEAVEKAILYGADGFAFTYNEPTIFSEYAESIAEIANRKGLFNVFVSSGYETPEALDYLKHINFFKIDLKGFSDEFYRKHCGTKFEYVLETIKEIWKKRNYIEIVSLIIPGENDSDEELRGMASFIAELDKRIPWHITRFHPDYLLRNKPETPIETLEKAWKIGKEEGLEYVYIGNVPGHEKESTYCPRCGNVLVERYGFYINKNVITEDGKCPYCGYKIFGHWGRYSTRDHQNR